jgi:hypothetical protein
MAQTNANVIWKIADLLPGPDQSNQYGEVTLPWTTCATRLSVRCAALVVSAVNCILHD